MFDFKPILLVIGILLTTLGCAMIIPAMIDLGANHSDWKVFAASSIFTLFIGVALAMIAWGRVENLNVKQAFLLTTSSWVALVAFAALPIAWGELDVLVVDMPPGTGDAQLTMAQQVPLAGAVIISTPQDLALIDARKGLKMFKNVDVPIFGIIENMSTFICPHCGERSDIFGHGGAEADAKRLGVPFLGAIPLHMDIRKNSDSGTPVVISQADGPHAAIYKNIALKIATRLFPEDDED